MKDGRMVCQRFRLVAYEETITTGDHEGMKNVYMSLHGPNVLT